MAIYSTPHSKEWFQALEAFNPDQAAMTKTVVEAAGRMDICSICGDHPAKDYKLVEEDLPPEAVGTIRLCNDCLTIRDESFVPFTS